MMDRCYSCGPVRLAEACVPYQQYTTTFDYMQGLMLGTIFPELYRPYVEKYK